MSNPKRLSEDEWITKMAALEEGCDISAGGGTIDDFIQHIREERANVANGNERAS